MGLFLISLSSCLLLVYRNTVDLCAISYPAILLNLLISSRSFLTDSLGFSIYRILSVKFYFFLPNLAFFFLNCSARPSSIIVNSSGESGHPCLIPNLKGSFQPFTIMLDVFFFINPCIMFINFPSIPNEC